MAEYKEDLRLLVESLLKTKECLEDLNIHEEKRREEDDFLDAQVEKLKDLLAESRLLNEKMEDQLNEMHKTEKALSWCERKLQDLRKLNE
jgi:hypothetical protein